MNTRKWKLSETYGRKFGGKRRDLILLPQIVSHPKFMGVLVMSTLTAFATTFLTNKDKVTEDQDGKKELMYAMLQHYEIPWAVQKDVITLFPTILDANSDAQFKEMIDLLPPFLQQRVDAYTRAKMLKVVPIFKAVEDPSVLLEFSRRLEKRFVPQYETVIWYCDEGSEMFFLFRGVVVVVVGSVAGGDRSIPTSATNMSTSITTDSASARPRRDDDVCEDRWLCGCG